ncbi:MAG: hypothetical protein JSR17_08855 [Proteobacteria bacterium]|nr:hypothetical protein [Pseudomonadota bacterium]
MLPRKTVNSSILIKRLSDNHVLNISLKSENKLGHGSFGCAYQVSHPHQQGLMVCKIIDLQGKSKNFHLPPRQLLRLSYREVAYLQKVGLLIGYFHDKDTHKMYILMKYIKGRPEYSINKAKHPEVEYLSFCALRKLHRTGIAHMDPHQGNFLINNTLEYASAIDFGLAKDHHFFREIRDYYKFLKKRHESVSTFMLHHGLTISQLIHFYCDEIQEHIRNNQWQVARQLFIYSVIIICALTGAGTLGVASVIAQRIIISTLLQGLSELVETFEDIYELRAWNQIYSARTQRYYQLITGLLVVTQGLLFALNLYRLTSSANVFFEECVANTTPIELANILTQIKPLVQSLLHWKAFFEKYLSSENTICEQYEAQIAQNAVYLPQFTAQTQIRHQRTRAISRAYAPPLNPH